MNVVTDEDVKAVEEHIGCGVITACNSEWGSVGVKEIIAAAWAILRNRIDISKYDGHTAGPWHVGGPFPSVTVCVETDPGRVDCENPEPPIWEPLALIHQGDEPPSKEVLANAALMADAPMFLRLLCRG